MLLKLLKAAHINMLFVLATDQMNWNGKLLVL